MCCFGLYEKIVDSILHFFRNIKGNLKFILPIAIGTFVGILLFGNLLKIAFILTLSKGNYILASNILFVGALLIEVTIIVMISLRDDHRGLHDIIAGSSVVSV